MDKVTSCTRLTCLFRLLAESSSLKHGELSWCGLRILRFLLADVTLGPTLARPGPLLSLNIARFHLDFIVHFCAVQEVVRFFLRAFVHRLHNIDIRGLQRITIRLLMNIALVLLEKEDHLMWKWTRLLLCIVKWLWRWSPPVCKDILRWKPGRNENFDLHLLLTLKSARRFGDENDEGRGTWCGEGRLRVPLPTASLGWIQMGSYKFKWIRMDFERLEVHSRMQAQIVWQLTQTWGYLRSGARWEETQASGWCWTS